MTTTSGDPRNLNHFLEGSGPLRGQLNEAAQAAVSAFNAFVATGSAAGGSLGGLQALIQLLSDMGPTRRSSTRSPRPWRRPTEAASGSSRSPTPRWRPT